MRYIVDGETYDGTPTEIADLILALKSIKIQPDQAVGKIDPTAFKELISESERVRAELAADPNYNPFVGVSKSPENEESSAVVSNKSELDTGVEYI